MEELGIEVTFDSAESAVMTDKDKTFIFYLNIKNKLSQQVKVESQTPTYLTIQGEEIEQDYWLGGLINWTRGTTIRSGAFRKMGVVIDRRKLKAISAGDRLYVTINVMNPSQRFNFGFVCTNESERIFSLCESNQEPVEMKLPQTAATSTAIDADVAGQTNTASALGKREITNCIERLELLEEKFGIAISSLYASCYYHENGFYSVEINFDVTSLSGGALERSIVISASAYNSAGQLLGTASSYPYITVENFIGFGPISVVAHLDQEPAKIRLFPAGV